MSLLTVSVFQKQRSTDENLFHIFVKPNCCKIDVTKIFVFANDTIFFLFNLKNKNQPNRMIRKGATGDNVFALVKGDEKG